MLDEYHENVIEWLDGSDTMSVTMHQKRFVNRILKLSEDPTNNIKIIAQNDDGSIFAHMPLSMLKLTPKTSRNWTVEEKSEWAARMKKAQAVKNGESDG